MIRRICLLPLLLLFALSTAWSTPTTPAVAQTQTAGQLDVVQGTYDNLMSLFYKPIDPPSLLMAGWIGLVSAANASGLPTPPDLGTLPSTRDGAFAAFSTAYTSYLGSLSSDISSDNLGFAIANAMVASLNDDHTAFLPPSSYKSFLGSLGAGSQSIGFGIETTGSAPWIVIDVAPSGPAATAGLQAGDEIIASDGTSLTGAGLQQFSSATGGPAGTTHSLAIDRQGQQLTIAVTRGNYYFPPLTSRMLAGNIGYIAIHEFTDAGLTLPDGTEIVADFDRRLNELNSAGATGLVLDLRDDPGGDSLTAEELLGRLLPASTETVVRFDERGHQATGVVAGPMNPTQLPLVVLVNGDSASSSELVASTLKEAGRALLVGERTEGALETSEILPLVEGAGLQVDVAEQVTAQTGFVIDGQGYPVDVEAADSRTSDDYRTGRDPQLQAAVQVLAQAPAPPQAESPSSISKQQINRLLSGYMPAASAMPTNDRLTSVIKTKTLDLNEPNEWLDAFGFGGRDPYQGQATLKSRGWLGSHLQNYNLAPLVPPTISIDIDLYATDAGAQEALVTNDFPDQQQFIDSPINLGDGTTAAEGIWVDLGSASISWRQGNVLLNVGYGDVPGFINMDTLVAAAKLLDQTYEQNPLPADLAGALAGQSRVNEPATAVAPHGGVALQSGALQRGDGISQVRAKLNGYKVWPEPLELGPRLSVTATQLSRQQTNSSAGAGLLFEIHEQVQEDLSIVQRAKRILHLP